jgi:2-haloacid dehalogenase
MYTTTLHALDLKPEEVAMVAAHEWDLGAAREVCVLGPSSEDISPCSLMYHEHSGMKTIYIERWTEDRSVNRDVLRDEFDLYINEGGVIELARRFGAVP